MKVTYHWRPWRTWLLVLCVFSINCVINHLRTKNLNNMSLLTSYFEIGTVCECVLGQVVDRGFQINEGLTGHTRGYFETNRGLYHTKQHCHVARSVHTLPLHLEEASKHLLMIASGVLYLWILPCWNIKIVVSGTGIPRLNERRLWGRLIFMMVISMLGLRLFILKKPSVSYTLSVKFTNMVLWKTDKEHEFEYDACIWKVFVLWPEGRWLKNSPKLWFD